MAEATFLVDNTNLGSHTDGLIYRLSKDLADRDDDCLAEWGSYVKGVEEDDDWLKVGKHYLPMVLRGVPVIKQVEEEEYLADLIARDVSVRSTSSLEDKYDALQDFEAGSGARQFRLGTDDSLAATDAEESLALMFGEQTSLNKNYDVLDGINENAVGEDTDNGSSIVSSPATASQQMDLSPNLHHAGYDSVQTAPPSALLLQDESAASDRKM